MLARCSPSVCSELLTLHLTRLMQAEEEWKESHTFRPSLDEVSKRLAELSQPSRAVRFSEPDNLLQAIEAERCVAVRLIDKHSCFRRPCQSLILCVCSESAKHGRSSSQGRR